MDHWQMESKRQKAHYILWWISIDSEQSVQSIRRRVGQVKSLLSIHRRALPIIDHRSGWHVIINLEMPRRLLPGLPELLLTYFQSSS